LPSVERVANSKENTIEKLKTEEQLNG